MRRQNRVRLRDGHRRKLFWLFFAAAVAALLFTDHVALLLVFLTLAISGLLIVVAFSNLETRDAEMQAAAAREATELRDLSAAKKPDATRYAA